ncbi:MAG: hypothetical protein IH945_12925 [Armatimonadetes bacterium]|nr:hypothetical protein [Armatimonadota bacterium]
MKAVVGGLAVVALLCTPACGRDSVEDVGGVRLVYKVNEQRSTSLGGQRLKENRKAIVKSFTRWFETNPDGIEGTVRTRGKDEIVIEILRQTDPSVIKGAFGSGARLSAYHATNISTSFRTRRYQAGDEDLVDGMSVVWFTKTVGGDGPIKFGDPAYQEMIDDWDLVLEGGDLAGARPLILADGDVVPELMFSADGARKLEAWSRRVLNQGEHLAFVIDGRVVSIAPLRDGTILSDNAFIDGEFEPADVRRLTDELNLGAVDWDMTMISEEVFRIPSS